MTPNRLRLFRWLPFQTLRGKLIFFACVATLPAFIFALYIATNERGAALQRAQIETLYIAKSASREHAYQVNGAKRLLDRLAETAMENTHGVELSQLLPAVLSGFPQFANMGLVSPDGELAYSVVPPPHHINMAEIPVFRAASTMHEVAVGTYLLGPIVQRPTLIMAKRLSEPRKTQEAIKAENPPALNPATGRILFAALNLEWMDQLAKNAGLPVDSNLLIVDREGNILANSLAATVSTSGRSQLQGIRQLLEHPDQLTRIQTPDGLSRLAVAQPLESLQGLWVVVGTPETQVYAVANAIFLRDVLMLALLTLLAIVSSLIATDFSVLKDIRTLAHATRRFGAGELLVRAPVPTPQGEIRNLAMAFNAMTERLARHSQLAVRSQERLRALSHRLQKARETEAARIAQELHDDLGQELSVMHLELEGLKRRIVAGRSDDTESMIQAFDEFGDRVDAAVRSVRRISSELRPGVLDRLGLEAGLEWLMAQFERRTGIQTRLIVDSGAQCTDSEISIVLFRITQEALSNIARHSQSTQVNAQLAVTSQEVCLSISDNGCGFDPDEEVTAPSLGLLGMQERARRLNGHLDIVSAPGQGVTLTACLPVKPAET